MSEVVFYFRSLWAPSFSAFYGSCQIPLPGISKITPKREKNRNSTTLIQKIYLHNYVTFYSASEESQCCHILAGQVVPAMFFKAI
jgi:hypothetical protein